MQIISIAFCFNNSFCSLAAGAISSLIKHTSEQYKYDIYIVHDDISEQNQFLIRTLNRKDNVSINFIPIEFKDYTVADLDYETRLTKYSFARLFLHKLLPEIDKILYLDCDIVVTSDISELFNQNLEGHSIGVCIGQFGQRGVDKLKLVQFNTKIPGCQNYQSQYDYFSKHLNLTDEQIDSYFNSGVILFDLKKSCNVLNKKLPELLKQKYIFADQDILNIAFKDDKKIIDTKFNVGAWSSYKYFCESSKYPTIIHYIGHKPTTSMNRPMAYCYWEEISHTNFYYPALEQFINRKEVDLERRIYNHFNNEKGLSDLYHNLKRFNRKRIKRKFIRTIIKPVVDIKKYKKLKRDPKRFFADSKSRFIKFLGMFYS